MLKIVLLLAALLLQLKFSTPLFSRILLLINAYLSCIPHIFLIFFTLLSFELANVLE